MVGSFRRKPRRLVERGVTTEVGEYRKMSEP